MLSLMKALLTFVAALAFGASALAVQGFRGFRPDQFPIPQIDPPVQPAGYAFAIWGVIYLWLILGAGFGVVLRPVEDDWDEMRLPLIGSLGIGAFWIPVANVSPFWATVMIWAMLALAVMALLKAGRDDPWWQRAPIGLYAGWLTAAASVATGLLLAGHGLLGAQTAALVAIGLALAVGLGVLLLRHDIPTYALALAWALVGVMVSNLAPLNLVVLATCAVGLAILALQILATRR